LSARRHPPTSALVPYTTLFRSLHGLDAGGDVDGEDGAALGDAVAALAREELAAEPAEARLVELDGLPVAVLEGEEAVAEGGKLRSEEHTSELQSLRHLVCRLLL